MVVKRLLQALSLFCYFQNVKDGEEEDVLNRTACHHLFDSMYEPQSVSHSLGMLIISSSDIDVPKCANSLTTLEKPAYIQYLMFFASIGAH